MPWNNINKKQINRSTSTKSPKILNFSSIIKKLWKYDRLILKQNNLNKSITYSYESIIKIKIIRNS